MKRILSFLLVFVLILTSVIVVSAEDVSSPKQEVIYGLLDLDGSVEDLYVVNIFNGGAITDYGDYSDIHNLTTSDKLSQNGDQISINTDIDKFYYQGTLKKTDLPWDISIKYFLDGTQILGPELAGKSGKLKIAMTVKENVNSSFFDNYALQITFSLDNNLCTNIKTSGATIAEAGSKKQLAYTALPGKGIDISITADIHDFEMSEISINGIKLSLGIKIDTDEFTEEISQLTDAIKELDVGAGELLDGLNQLSSGMQKYTDGMKAFKDGLKDLSDGSDKLNEGAASLKKGLSFLTGQNDSLVGGALSIQQATFDSVNAQLGETGLPVLTSDNYSAILSAIPNLATVKTQLDSVVQFTQGLKDYTAGIARLGKGASDLADGISEFSLSSSMIASSANELYISGYEINTAIKNIRDGLSTYKDGTNELRNGTSGMSSEMNDRIEEILGGISGKGDEVISFVSEKNTNVDTVQFVLKTASIDLPEAPKAVIPVPVKLSLWQKFLKLFGLYE